MTSLEKNTLLLSNFILDNIKKTESDLPLIVGFSGPQGGGKTTLCKRLIEELAKNNLKAITFSSDDLYLSFENQKKLSATYPENTLFRFRGNAGTIDAQLGYETLKALKGINSGNNKVKIPTYDKSMHQGLGDRVDVDLWPEISGHIDVVLFEGWNMGFRSVSDDTIDNIFAVDQEPGGWKAKPKNHFNNFKQTLRHSPGSVKQINEMIKAHEELWYKLFDLFIYIRAEDQEYIYEWRWEQETKLQESLAKSGGGEKKGTMTRQQVNDFVDRFMPGYEVNGLELFKKGFFPIQGKEKIPQINLVLGRNRDVLHFEFI
ncbi:hypothetical protein BB559_004002 [Furculomyces boomerangus]|uniref:Phosphoribulokinase/uridine kinase domain-containing protein n=1 Tax=Furculomyces boomerangus TaxID=61424 RepID=A0A2T9YH87_9FUNG|nr:hypothetical protein BB559_004002 [Furculomyces boomerangus]